MTKPSKTEIETALAKGNLYAAMRNGRFWVLRRNGATQTWKTRPMDFSIPVKCGLKSCARLTDTDSVTRAPDWTGNFVISDTPPAK